MLHKTRGIALNYIRYRDTSIISRIYTEEFGLQSYIVNGVRSARAKGKMALFQLLTLLDLVIYHKESAHLHRISEIKCSHPYVRIPFEIKKTTIGIFLSEVLGKIVKENEHDLSGQFAFIHDSLLAFDQLTDGYEHFHIQFLLKLTYYLGFDLEQTEELYHQVHYLSVSDSQSEEVIAFLKKLYSSSFQSPVKSSLAVRREALKNILSFYDHHLGTLSSLKSLEVLRQVLH